MYRQQRTKTGVKCVYIKCKWYWLICRIRYDDYIIEYPGDESDVLKEIE